MSWISPRQAMNMLDKRKLAELTQQTGQQEFIGVGDSVTRAFTTPFVFGSDLKVYFDGVLTAAYTTSIDYTNEERIVVTTTVPPTIDVQVTASSMDSANADNLNAVMLRAQGLVRGMIDASLYVVPADDDPAVPEPLLGWAAAIGWYFLATDPRRPRLLEAYPELARRYDDVYGGVDSDMKRVSKGQFSLRGILTPIDPAVTPGTNAATYSSDFPVFTKYLYRGPA